MVYAPSTLTQRTGKARRPRSTGSPDYFVASWASFLRRQIDNKSHFRLGIVRNGNCLFLWRDWLFWARGKQLECYFLRTPPENVVKKKNARNDFTPRRAWNTFSRATDKKGR